MSDLPRLYSFKELLASFPEGKMSADELHVLLRRMGFKPGPRRGKMFFTQQQMNQIMAGVNAKGVGYIYFILSGDTHVKIGYSANMDIRLAALQSANPFELKLYRMVEGTVAKERELHARFKHLRVRGEWFLWCDEIKQAIREL